MEEPIEVFRKGIRKSIEALKAKRDEYDRMIRQFEAALETSGNGSSSPTAGHVSGKVAFAMKYERPAWELIPTVFSDAQPIMHIGQIDHALQAKGFQYKRGTVAAAIKRLLEDGTLERVKPARGSGFSYGYQLVTPSKLVRTGEHAALEGT